MSILIYLPILLWWEMMSYANFYVNFHWSTFSLGDLANTIPTLINFCSITGEIYPLFITQMKSFPSFIKRVKKLTQCHLLWRRNLLVIMSCGPWLPCVFWLLLFSPNNRVKGKLDSTRYTGFNNILSLEL